MFLRYAVIDIGTNSCRLLIGEQCGGRIIPIYSTLETTRLGEKLQASLAITKDAMLRTCGALNNFKFIMQEYEVEKYRVVATSAVREATNQSEFINLVKDECNINVEVISGEEEARLSYQGVIASLNLDASPLVVDLGGGSTEIIHAKDIFLSLPVGAVKAYEAGMSASDIALLLEPLEKYQDCLDAYPLVVVGGTATTLVALKYAMKDYSPEKIHGQILLYDEIKVLYNKLEVMPVASRRQLPGLQPERADIITSGILILLTIMETFRYAEIIVSEGDLMDAIIREM